MQWNQRVSLEDYREAQRLMVRMQRSLIAVLILKWVPVVFFGLAAVVLVSACLVMGNSEQLHSLLLNFRPLAFLVAFYFLGHVLHFFRVRKAFERNPVMQRQTFAEIGESYLALNDGAGAQSSESWDHFNRFCEGKRVFVLGRPGRSFTILAKSAMNPDELAHIRRVLAAKVPGR
jgi:hypothetical protein